MTRVPRARRNGEPVETKRADQLGPADYGRIVQHPGHRGYLRCAQPEGHGVSVCTTTGVATYPPDSPWFVWGP